MITEALLNASIEGTGKLHKTSIFPCGIFQCMKGVNRAPGDPNYDLFQLALKSTAQRLYPNYANVDWSGNAGMTRMIQELILVRWVVEQQMAGILTDLAS